MKLLAKIYLLVFLSFFTFVFTWIPVYADQSFENLEIRTQKINPGSFYYSFKRLWEKFRIKLAFDAQSKVSINESLLKTRLAELNYVVGNKLLSEVQTSSERFAYQAGTLVEEVVKINKDKEKTIKSFEQLSKVLEKLRDNYPANSSFWMLIQHDINTLNILSERLK